MEVIRDALSRVLETEPSSRVRVFRRDPRTKEPLLGADGKQLFGYKMREPRYGLVREGGTLFRVTAKTYAAMMRSQDTTPYCLIYVESVGIGYWMYKNAVYVERQEPDTPHARRRLRSVTAAIRRKEVDERDIWAIYQAGQILAERKLIRTIERAQAIIAGQEAAVSDTRHIRDDVKLFVWRRDQGRCTKCGSQERLHYDHIIPLSKGGSSTARNIQILCESCNLLKGGEVV